ncbi:protein FAR1-RELATED SEQUENCE 5-like protein [Carex littledalei]|uniref:Protein FAR1-RELATED SEQUENCE 5-like protein n=1 Tax=Carex littledalei TaxID=544730 RepID=A0A833R9W3_9POAL|nr:protein FAR1-RELATED SEQUENCE 5-like protein [Carex littledalei]
MNTSSEMSLGAASCSIAASVSSTPSLESPNHDNHGPIKLRMEGDDPYIGIEEFPNLEYPTHQGVGGELAILLEEEEDEEKDEGEEEVASNYGAAIRVVRSRIGDIMNEVRLMVPDTSSTKQLELFVPIQTIALEEEDKEDGDNEQTYLDPPLSQCKGRKKRPARFKPVIETTVRQRRTCSYCQTKETHNIRTCPKMVTIGMVTELDTIFFYLPALYNLEVFNVCVGGVWGTVFW